MLKAKGSVINENSLLAEAINKRMEELGWSLIDLSDKAEISYEHARKLSRGTTRPSHLVLKAVCAALKLSFDDMNELVVADTIKHQFGNVPEKLAGKNPKLVTLERLAEKLDPRQLKDLEDIARTMAKNARG
jgi:transcriptional regulator with XRE-family HTH domain